MQVVKLDEALKYVVKFTVTGTGHFPVDMLRYDRCLPDSSEDWDSAMRRKDESDTFNTRARSVHMIRHVPRKDMGVTEARWASFGWRVS